LARVTRQRRFSRRTSQLIHESWKPSERCSPTNRARPSAIENGTSACGTCSASGRRHRAVLPRVALRRR
jgi:hypothetical protein